MRWLVGMARKMTVVRVAEDVLGDGPGQVDVEALERRRWPGCGSPSGSCSGRRRRSACAALRLDPLDGRAVRGGRPQATPPGSSQSSAVASDRRRARCRTRAGPVRAPGRRGAPPPSAARAPAAAGHRRRRTASAPTAPSHPRRPRPSRRVEPVPSRPRHRVPTPPLTGTPKACGRCPGPRPPRPAPPAPPAPTGSPASAPRPSSAACGELAAAHAPAPSPARRPPGRRHSPVLALGCRSPWPARPRSRRRRRPPRAALCRSFHCRTRRRRPPRPGRPPVASSSASAARALRRAAVAELGHARSVLVRTSYLSLLAVRPGRAPRPARPASGSRSPRALQRGDPRVVEHLQGLRAVRRRTSFSSARATVWPTTSHSSTTADGGGRGEQPVVEHPVRAPVVAALGPDQGGRARPRPARSPAHGQGLASP